MLSAFWGLQSEKGEGDREGWQGCGEGRGRGQVESWKRRLARTPARAALRAREPRRASKPDGASGRGLPPGRGPNPWPASRVSDPELTPSPWQPPARPIWLSAQLQGSSAAGRARAGRRDPFLQSAHGRGPFVWVSSPLLPLRPAPKLAPGGRRCAGNSVSRLPEPSGAAGLTVLNYPPVKVPGASLLPSRPTQLFSPLPLTPVCFDFRIFSFLKDKFAIHYLFRWKGSDGFHTFLNADSRKSQREVEKDGSVREREKPSDLGGRAGGFPLLEDRQNDTYCH